MNCALCLSSLPKPLVTHGFPASQILRHYCEGCCDDQAQAVALCRKAYCALLSRCMPVPAKNRWLHIKESVDFLLLLQIHSLLQSAENLLVTCERLPQQDAEVAQDDVAEREEPSSNLVAAANDLSLVPQRLSEPSSCFPCCRRIGSANNSSGPKRERFMFFPYANCCLLYVPHDHDSGGPGS